MRTIFQSGNNQGKMPLGTLGSRWEDNIKIDLRHDVKV